MFNTWYTNPEAFSSDYEEYQALMRSLAEEDSQPVEADLTDIVRQHDEAEDSYSDAEADADTLASAGMGTDEDYGLYADEWEQDDGFYFEMDE